MVQRRVANSRTVEVNDIVIWFAQEWTVHAMAEGNACVLRHHNDPDAKGDTFTVPVSSVALLTKAVNT